MIKNVCKSCRRLEQKLFLKGEKCLSPKCPMVKRPYPPGAKKQKRNFRKSEYAKELAEKQKLKKSYGLTERQFSGYVKEIFQNRSAEENAALSLIGRLEKRLDNLVFRLGLARSRREARELVSHGHFLVNSKPVDIPSFSVRKGDVISIKETKKTKTYFKNLAITLKNHQAPGWLKLNKDTAEGEITGEPSLEGLDSPVDIPSIFEFYSR